MAENGVQYRTGNNKKRKKGRSVIDIIEGVKPVTDEVKRFEMILYSKDTLAMVLGDPWALSEARKLLTGNNLMMLNAAAETNTQRRYRMVLDKLCDLTVSQFAASATIFPTMEYTMLVRDRCELCKDTAACAMFDKIINGDPDSEIEEEMLGLIGLWKLQDNRTAGAILVAAGQITKSEFEKQVDAREKSETTEREKVHGCSLCGGVFPESKCVKAKINDHEEWICKADFEMLSSQGRAEKAAPPQEQPKTEVKPAVPEVKKEDICPTCGHERSAHEFHDEMEFCLKCQMPCNWPDEEQEIPPQPPKEKEPVLPNNRLALMKHEIEERMRKLRGEKKPVEKPKEKESKVEELKILYHTQDATDWTVSDFVKEIVLAKTLEDFKLIHSLVDKSLKLSDYQKKEIKMHLIDRMQAYLVGQESYSPGHFEIREPFTGPKRDVHTLSIEELDEIIEKLKKRLERVKDVEGPRDISLHPGDEVLDTVRGVGEDGPDDYSQFGYGDFEPLLKSIDDLDEAFDMMDHIDESKKLSIDERKILHNLLTDIIQNLQKGG